jgi:uncharacterized iron-regulated protein
MRSITTLTVAVVLLAVMPARADELDLLPLGGGELATRIGAAAPGSFVATATEAELTLPELAAELAGARVALIGEAHTEMQQKLFHAALLEAMADLDDRLVLGMEFFLRSDQEALDAWVAGEIDEEELLRRTEWYDRGSYRFGYYRPVMEAARLRGIRIVGLNVPREIPRAVNRGGLDALTDEQRELVGGAVTSGTDQHRYLIGRYFGETVALMPQEWFENMYAAQCLWDVVMARSILGELGEDETMMVIVGSGHVAYHLGISQRIQDELEAAGRPPIGVATFCPVTAPPPPDPTDEPSGHPMGGGHGHGMGAAVSPARFARSLADFIGAFPDSGGIEAYPQLGLQLGEEDDRVVVAMAWPDTPAAAVGFEHGDRIVDVNGYAPPSLSELRTWLAATEWRQRLGFQVERDGASQEIGLLLYPDVDLTERVIAPGWSVEPVGGVDPSSASPVEPVEGAAEPHAELVSRDGTPLRVEVRSDDLLDEVHELDENGRIARSLYRVARPDGVVEVRYTRAVDGSPTEIIRLDRTGQPVAP